MIVWTSWWKSKWQCISTWQNSTAMLVQCPIAARPEKPTNARMIQLCGCNCCWFTPDDQLTSSKQWACSTFLLGSLILLIPFWADLILLSSSSSPGCLQEFGLVVLLHSWLGHLRVVLLQTRHSAVSSNTSNAQKVLHCLPGIGKCLWLWWWFHNQSVHKWHLHSLWFCVLWKLSSKKFKLAFGVCQSLPMWQALSKTRKAMCSSAQSWQTDSKQMDFWSCNCLWQMHPSFVLSHCMPGMPAWKCNSTVCKSHSQAFQNFSKFPLLLHMSDLQKLTLFSTSEKMPFHLDCSNRLWLLFLDWFKTMTCWLTQTQLLMPVPKLIKRGKPCQPMLDPEHHPTRCCKQEQLSTGILQSWKQLHNACFFVSLASVELWTIAFHLWVRPNFVELWQWNTDRTTVHLLPLVSWQDQKQKDSESWLLVWNDATIVKPTVNLWVNNDQELLCRF